MPLISPLTLEGPKTEQALFDVAVRALVPGRADWASIHSLTGDGGLHLRAVGHADPYKVNLAWELDRRWPPPPDARAGARAVVRSGALETGGVPDELLATIARSPEHLQVLRALGLRSYCCAPMREPGGEVVGALTLVMAESGRRYADAELERIQRTADAIAARAAHLRREGLAQIGVLD
jgi:hypothetical protein